MTSEILTILLRDTNTLNHGLPIDDPYEKASAQRFIGIEMSKTISNEVGITVDDAVTLVDIVHGHRSNKDSKKPRPRGVTSAGLIDQIVVKSRYGKEYTSRWLSLKLMPVLENMGFVESFKGDCNLKEYRVNGYKTGFSQEFRS